MKFEKRMKCGQKMLEENVRRPFVNWYKKVKKIIDKLPDETEVYGVSIIFNADQNLSSVQEIDKLEERYECKAAFLPDLSEVMLDVNNKLKLEEDEFVFREKLENMALDPKCKDTEISNTFWVTKVIVLFAENPKIFMQIEGTGEENIVSFEESYGGLLENFRGYEGIVTVSNNPYNATTVKFDISFFKE